MRFGNYRPKNPIWSAGVDPLHHFGADTVVLLSPTVCLLFGYTTVRGPEVFIRWARGVAYKLKEMPGYQLQAEAE